MSSVSVISAVIDLSIDACKQTLVLLRFLQLQFSRKATSNRLHASPFPELEDTLFQRVVVMVCVCVCVCVRARARAVACVCARVSVSLRMSICMHANSLIN